MFSPNAKATAEKKTNHLKTALKAVRGDFRLSGKSELRQPSPFTPIDVRPYRVLHAALGGFHTVANHPGGV
jgi:hypothetical protein